MLFSVLVTQTEFHQFLKLPVVFQHYFEHAEVDPDISFTEFLSIHYLNAGKPDADHSRDMQLPFKTSDCDMTAVPPVVLPGNQIVSFQILHVREIPLPVYMNEAITSLHVSDIWQPPRQA